MEMQTSQKFEYTYSSKQQKEIESIRNKYLFKQEDKLETLRRLDKSVEKPGTMAAIILGTTDSEKKFNSANSGIK